MEDNGHRAAIGDPWDLFENAACGQLVTTPRGLIIAVNKTFLTWTGYAAEDLAQLKFFADLLTPGGRIYHETHFAPLLQMQGRAGEIAIEIVAADGRRLPALVNAVVKRQGQGDGSIRIAVFGAADRREYERELLRQRRRAEESEERARRLAETLQESLLPSTPPAIPGLEVGTAFRPAGTGAEVGGDFYDVFQVGEGEWAVVVGDVCGKGAAAATITALARYTLRAAAMQTQRPAQVLQVLNEAMLHQQVETFCTVAYARISSSRIGRPRVTLASGGHPLAILVPTRGSPAMIGKPGTLLGVVDELGLDDHSMQLDAGELLVLFTDGVIEARRGRDLFGEERLLDLLSDSREMSATQVAHTIVEKVVAFQDGLPRDDIAVVVLKVPRLTTRT